MRAIWLSEFGAPSVLVPGEAPEPVPGPGQVRIEVEAASVIFVETQMRAGTFAPPGAARKLPYIPGNGVGGVVGVVGPGVDAGLVGRRVVATTGGSGGYAERALAAVEDVYPLRNEVTIRDATALVSDGRTAVGLFQLGAPAAGETVLVEAAAGGLGSLLVQLCVAAGATVIGAVGSDSKLDVVRKLGAEPVNYAEPGWAQSLPPVDVVFDGVGGEVGRAAAGLVGAGSRFVAHGLASGRPTAPDAMAGSGATVLGVMQTREMDLHELTRQALDGQLRPIIGQTFPLERAADAHAEIEARRSVGKTLLLV